VKPSPKPKRKPRRKHFESQSYYIALAKIKAKKYGLNPLLFVAQIMQESAFDPLALSDAKAQGIAQITVETACGWHVDPWEPDQALDAAARNMAGYVRTYRAQGHDYWTAHKLALAAYNAGPGAVAKYKGVPPYPETQHYVKVILPVAGKQEEKTHHDISQNHRRNRK
jgi:soluble lytic murein transglycosylase-like protein